VTKDTLIPRPESEEIITLLSEFQSNHGSRLLDIGTGSGCLAITATLEFPRLQVSAWDISDTALKIAETNAANYHANVRFSLHDLRDTAPTDSEDIIIANLPYVDPKWDRSPETNYEPSVALFAENHGLLLINKLIAHNPLPHNGLMILEADSRQLDEIADYASHHGFQLLKKGRFAIALQLTK
jgi:release factor glutamine methyltransferase